MTTGTLITALGFDTRTKVVEPFQPELLPELARETEAFYWIDLQGKQIEPLKELLRSLGIDLELEHDVEAPEVLPRIHEHAECLAFQLYEIPDPGRYLDTSRGIESLDYDRLLMVLGRNWVLTFHHDPMAVVDHVREQSRESFAHWGKTQSFLVFLFLQRCLYDYGLLNLANDNYLDGLEEAMMRGEKDAVADTAVAGHNILVLKKLTSCLYLVLMLLATKRSRFVSEESRLFYNEMMHNAVSLRAAVDSSRDLLDGVLASLQADSVRRTNDIASFLTTMATIIMPLTLITGIYGMNFHYMPELEIPWAYYAVLGFMAALALALGSLFWRLGWLRRK